VDILSGAVVRMMDVRQNGGSPILHPCSLSTLQIGSTPKRSR
jgi:hypothetical protein